jgi:hypothetical protein
VSFQGNNYIFGKGVINTQGVVRLSELATGVTFAIVGGTGKFKKAHGTVTVKTQSSHTGSRERTVILPFPPDEDQRL